MSVFLLNILRSGSIAFVGQKALRCFGKKDYADVIAGVGFAAVGIEIILLVSYWSTCFTNWLDKLYENPVIKFFVG